MAGNNLLSIKADQFSYFWDMKLLDIVMNYSIDGNSLKLKNAIITGIHSQNSHFPKGIIEIDSNLKVASFVMDPETFYIKIGGKPVTFNSTPCNSPTYNRIDPSLAIQISQEVSQGDLEDIRTSGQFDTEMLLLRNDMYALIEEQNATSSFWRALKERYEKESNPQGSDAVIQYPNDVRAQELFLQVLKKAIDYTANCANKLSPGETVRTESGYDVGTQVGKFGADLTLAINQRWRGFVKTGGETQVEKNKKNSGKLSSKQQTVDSPIASVNPTISQLEIQRAQLEADNKIIYVNSSGVNTFSQPAGDPNNVYSILDIMRDEQSAYIFEDETVNINKIKQQLETGDSRAACEKILSQLNPAQLVALLKAIELQIDYNTRIMERVGQLINKLKGSPSFKLSSLWSGFGGFNMGDFKWNGVNFDGDILKKILEAADKARSDVWNYGAAAAGQMIDSAKSIAGQLRDNVNGMISMGTKAVTDDFEELMNNIRANSKALDEALKNISYEDIGACHLINEVVKLSKSSTDVQSSVNNLQARAKKDLQNMTSKLKTLQTVNEQQQRLNGYIETIKTIVKSKLGG